jgi:hypothetical protein
MPSTPQITRIYDVMGRQMSGALSGAIKPADAMKQAETEVNALFS